MNGYIWVACSKVEFGPVGEQRHLVRVTNKGRDLTTVCGHSASHAEIWRVSTSKPKCQICENSKVNR